jgi:hypothetical protein
LSREVTERGRNARQRPGLRQPSAALLLQGLAMQSGRGLPQSRTSRNFPARLSKRSHSFNETALAEPMETSTAQRGRARRVIISADPTH